MNTARSFGRNDSLSPGFRTLLRFCIRLAMNPGRERSKSRAEAIIAARSAALRARPKLLARIPQIVSVGSVAEGPCGSVACFFELQQIVSPVSGTGARSISRKPCGIGRDTSDPSDPRPEAYSGGEIQVLRFSVSDFQIVPGNPRLCRWLFLKPGLEHKK
jgi:hypothetical protein